VPPTPVPTTAPPPPPPPPPAPAPSPAPLVEKIVELLGGDHDTAAQVVAQLDTNPLTTFTTLVLKEEKQQAEEKKSGPAADNVVANVCTK
jgi:colicin import membrane protein